MLAGPLAARLPARRLALGCVVLTVVAGAGVARADLSAPEVVASSFPLGTRCAARSSARNGASGATSRATRR
jgi:hypothetical protein